MRPLSLLLALAAGLFSNGPAWAAEPETVVLLEDGRWRVTENRYPPGSESPLQVRELHRESLRTLAEAGVEFAIGADSYFSTSSRDAFLLNELGSWSNLELLHRLPVQAGTAGPAAGMTGENKDSSPPCTVALQAEAPEAPCRSTASGSGISAERLL